MADVSKDQGGLPNGRPLLRPFSGHGTGGPGALRPLGARRIAVSPLTDARSPATDEHLASKPSGDSPTAVAPQEGVVSGTAALDAAATGEITAAEPIALVPDAPVGEESTASSPSNDVDASVEVTAELSPHPVAASEAPAPSVLDVAAMLARQPEDATSAFDPTGDGEALDSPFRSGDPLAAALDGENYEVAEQLVVNFVEFPEAGSDREALLAGLDWAEPDDDREEEDNAASAGVSSLVSGASPLHAVPSGEGEALQIGIRDESDEHILGEPLVDADPVDMVAPVAPTPDALSGQTFPSANDLLVVSDDDYAMVDIDPHAAHEEHASHEQREADEHDEHDESDELRVLHELYASGEPAGPQEPTLSEQSAAQRQSTEGSLSTTTSHQDLEAESLHERELATALPSVDDTGGVSSAITTESAEPQEPLVAMSHESRADDARSDPAVDGSWPGTDLAEWKEDRAVGESEVGHRGQSEFAEAVATDEDSEGATTCLVGAGVGEGVDTHASAAPRTQPPSELSPVAELADVLDAELAGFRLLPSEAVAPAAPILDLDALMRDEDGQTDGSQAADPDDAGSEDFVALADQESMAAPLSAADSGDVTPFANRAGGDASAARGASDREEPRGAISATDRLEQGDAELQDFLLRSRSQAHVLSTLEMVARRVRGGEIVPTIDAGSSPEAVLASVLASLLSPRT